jgi:threonine dehydrogenase-like Zn-dependent dehydrogenase
VVKEETGGEGADLTVDAVGSAATKRGSLDAVRAGGAAVWIGLHENPLTFDSFGLTLPEKQIFGSYAAKLDDLQLALEWMSTGRVDAKTWTTRFALADGEAAFQRALAAQGADIKCIIGEGS